MLHPNTTPPNSAPSATVHVHANTSASYDAASRKRDRDKVNQRNKRRREQEYVLSLEERILHLQSLLPRDEHALPSRSLDSELPPKGQSVTSALSPNAGTRHSPQSTSGLDSQSPVAAVDHDESFATPAEPDAQVQDDPTDAMKMVRAAAEPSTANNLTYPASVQADLSQPTAIVHESALTPDAFYLVVPAARIQKLLAAPEWLRMPSSDFVSATSLEASTQLSGALLRLQKEPGFIALCPAEPKPIDLLYGGSSNVLANLIAAITAIMPLLPPEKFAASYFIYKICRWRIWPCCETYEDLPDFLRPTILQLTQKHNLEYDFIVWPQVRDNLIRHGAKYDLKDLLVFLSCTYRIRDCFNKDFVCRVGDGDLQICDSFYKKFTQIENWSILESFWDKFPDAVAGPNPHLMLREHHFMPSIS